MVKINIAYPPFGSSQLIEVDDEKKWRVFLDKRLSEEVPADSLGDEFKGYVFKLTGGYDKEGFAMMQGVMLNSRTRLLLDGRTGQYTPKRIGCRKRKSVRGCIVGTDMSWLNVIIVKRGETDLPKLTDAASNRPSLRGPKRANNIRKAWGLSKKDDVRQYVVKRVKPGKEGKKDRIKSPKIQRLITPKVKSRRRRLLKESRIRKEKSRKEATDYANLLKQLRAQKRASLLSKRRESRSSKSATTTTITSTTATTAATEKKKPEKQQKQVKQQPGKASKAPVKGGVKKPKTLQKKKQVAAKTATTTQAATTTAAKTEAKKSTKTDAKKPVKADAKKPATTKTTTTGKTTAATGKPKVAPNAKPTGAKKETKPATKPTTATKPATKPATTATKPATKPASKPATAFKTGKK